MNIKVGKRIVCITGSVWTGKRNAPRHMLEKEGFGRPRWFTTYHPITDAQYQIITSANFHLACARNEVLTYMKYGGEYVGIMVDDFNTALNISSTGILVIGPQEIVAQISHKIPQTIIFTFKDTAMKLSPYLSEAEHKGQLHRIDVNVLLPDAWSKVNRTILKTLGVPS